MNRLRQAWDDSSMSSLARRFAAGSVAVRWGRRTTAHVDHLVGTVTTASLPTPFDQAIERSTIVSLERDIEDVVRESFIHRWLTAEPKSEPIVVDLHDTYIVGSAIAALEQFGPIWGLFAGLRGAYNTLAKLAARSRSGRIIAKVLAPPEPPEDRRDS